MDEHGLRISRSALARMTGATALGLAVAPEVASAGRSGQPHDHLHRSGVLIDASFSKYIRVVSLRRIGVSHVPTLSTALAR